MGNMSLCLLKILLYSFKMKTEFAPVKKTSRTGKYGKLIQCPKCNHVKTIYHLSWSALGCQGCDDMIDKYDWLIETK